MNYYNNSPFYNVGGVTNEPQNPQMQQQLYYNSQPDFSKMKPVQQPVPQTPQYPAPEANISSGGFSFTVRKDEELRGDLVVSDGPVEEVKKKRGRPRKSETVAPNAIIKAEEGTVEPMPTMYTYQETTDMLRGTLAQIDQLAAQVKQELDNVAASRTLKSKYNIMVGLSGNLGDIIGQKITAIKEINNAISKSNEMDYKREKDRKSVEGNVNDDKVLMDMYNAYIQNPGGLNGPIAPTGAEATLGAPNIIRAGDTPQQQGFAPDMGYLGYVTNMSPEQKLMMMEDNPNVKLCVVYDAATGNKAFQWMDMSTGSAIPGMPERDPMFLEDTTIDLAHKMAKNINLNETYPVVVLNENVVNEY